jgi:hypothetical protein
MKPLKSIIVRKAIISATTAVAISLPGIGSAGLLDRIKSRVDVGKTQVGQSAAHEQTHRPRPIAQSGFSVRLVPHKKAEQHELFLTFTINLK